jgi:hypothetical protein
MKNRFQSLFCFRLGQLVPLYGAVFVEDKMSTLEKVCAAEVGALYNLNPVDP